ncbi:hypothetical protein C7S14_2437 [Burkholderia cepacia]|nr:hypothetical protein C7S14_2437 [Burkholderia cepacia]
MIPKADGKGSADARDTPAAPHRRVAPRLSSFRRDVAMGASA